MWWNAREIRSLTYYNYNICNFSIYDIFYNKIKYTWWNVNIQHQIYIVQFVIYDILYTRDFTIIYTELSSTIVVYNLSCSSLINDFHTCSGSVGAKRRGIGSWPRSDSSPSQEEASFSNRGASTSESRSIPVHRSIGSHVGQFGMAAWPWARSVFRQFRDQHGGRADARPSEQKGAGEAARRNQEVPSGQHRARDSSAANVELWSSGNDVKKKKKKEGENMR